MSFLDYLLLAAVAACAYLAIRTYRRSGGSCRCGASKGCAGCTGCGYESSGGAGCSRRAPGAGDKAGEGHSQDASGCPACRRDDKSTT